MKKTVSNIVAKCVWSRDLLEQLLSNELSGHAAYLCSCVLPTFDVANQIWPVQSQAHYRDQLWTDGKSLNHEGIQTRLVCCIQYVPTHSREQHMIRLENITQNLSVSILSNVQNIYWLCSLIFKFSEVWNVIDYKINQWTRMKSGFVWMTRFWVAHTVLVHAKPLEWLWSSSVGSPYFPML